MKNYLVSFIKNGELFESVVTANKADDARNFVANKESIPFNFEIKGDGYCSTYNENNHVAAVIEL